MQKIYNTPLVPHDMTWYYYGRIAGLCIIGPAYDFVLQGSAYMILDILIFITALWQFILMFWHIDNGHIEVVLFIYGLSI
jgi:hypothetical protein